ncbi:RdgB/HAM1 family non-canonical purine NTP pyrophosphatase [Celerinatantimonas yamalensis]|uniref:dITP/XTP pyrophosphatase n=1 Tax=Celerinatantimonas yamalensis TaxID=559956 RepID=A0ABW9G9C4_9GAMM
MANIVLATSNRGKVAELQSLLQQCGLTIIAQSEFALVDADETGTTFVENAIIKARHAAHQTGLAAIADDSGLAVEALGGAPGIYSARYSGDSATDQSNIAKLLEALNDTPAEKRQACFHCVLVYMRSDDDPTPLICHGQWQGHISRSAQGEQGFGYDPIFIPAGYQQSAAQLDASEKNRISHRGQALAQLLQHLEVAC